jgi:hypothetical protein
MSQKFEVTSFLRLQPSRSFWFRPLDGAIHATLKMHGAGNNGRHVDISALNRFKTLETYRPTFVRYLDQAF